MSILLRRRPACSYSRYSGFELCDWLYSDGTGQYIDLGLSLGSYTSKGQDLQVEVEGTIYDLSNSPYIFGCGSGANYAQYLYMQLTTSTNRYVTAGAMTWSGHPQVGEKFKILANTLDGARVYDSNDNLLVTSTKGAENWVVSVDKNCYIFAAHKSEPANFAKMAMNHIKFDFYIQNTRCIFDLYPCIDKKTNEAGLFDINTGKFYPNRGTGEFVAGNGELTIPL